MLIVYNKNTLELIPVQFGTNSIYPDGEPFEWFFDNVIVHAFPELSIDDIGEYRLNDIADESKVINLIENSKFLKPVIIDGEFVDIDVLPALHIGVDKVILSMGEVATIAIVEDGVTVVIDNVEYVLDDNSLEYSSDNIGKEILIFKLAGFVDKVIIIEVK